MTMPNQDRTALIELADAPPPWHIITDDKGFETIVASDEDNAPKGDLICHAFGGHAELLRSAPELREALRLIKLACLGTSEKDGWTAQRILSCITRLCIDAGVRESYRELGSERRYEALSVRSENRIAFALRAQAAPDVERR